MHRKYWIPILAGWALSTLVGTAWAQQAEPTAERSISVVGRGKVSARPTMASVQVGVVTQAESAQDAMRQNNEAMANLLKLAREMGIEEKYVQTVSFNVQPEYQQPDPRQAQSNQPIWPKIVAYRVTNRIHVEVRELNKLGQILDAMVQSGSNEVSGVTFEIAEREGLEDEARRKAMSDARRKAVIYAESADVSVGAVKSIREQSYYAPPPQPYARTMMAMESSAVPIAAGELDIEVTVHVEYAIK